MGREAIERSGRRRARRRGRDVAEDVVTLDETEVLEGHGRGQCVPGEGVPVVEGARAEVLAEEGVVDAPDATVADMGRYPPVSALPQTEEVGPETGPLRGEEPARCGRSRWPPRRR